MQQRVMNLVYDVSLTNIKFTCIILSIPKLCIEKLSKPASETCIYYYMKIRTSLTQVLMHRCYFLVGASIRS